MTLIPSLSPCFLSCSIEAALNVSAAAKTHEILFSLRNFAIFAIVVVFPEPFIPQNKITYGSFACSAILSFIFSITEKGSIRISPIISLNEFFICYSISFFENSFPTILSLSSTIIFSATSRATLFSKRSISSSSA